MYISASFLVHLISFLFSCTPQEFSNTKVRLKLVLKPTPLVGLHVCVSVSGYVAAGLVDDTKQFTHEEFKKRNASMPNHAQLHDRIFRTMFRGLDINGDGVVSIDEWELHYKCMGIDPKHAKASFEAMDTIRDNVVSGEDFLA